MAGYIVVTATDGSWGGEGYKGLNACSLDLAQARARSMANEGHDVFVIKLIEVGFYKGKKFLGTRKEDEAAAASAGPLPQTD